MKLLIALPILGVLLLSGCATSDPEMESQTIPYTDEELRVMVEREITGDPRLPAHEIGILADAERGEVTLDGMVTTESMRTRAVELAKRAEPEIVIIDNIDVIPVGVEHDNYTDDMAEAIREQARETGRTLGDSVEDAWIYSSVVSRLALDDDTPARDIEVDVENQSVTLGGTVHSDYARTEAERIAKNTEGVNEVNNMITVN